MEEKSHTSVILWVLSGIFALIIIALIGVFLIYPKISKVPEIEIPNVSNMTIVEAEKTLKNLGFNVSDTIEHESSDTIEKGMIVKTSPAIGTTRKKGTTIILYESTGKGAYIIENYVGKKVNDVKTILENNYGLNVVIEKMEMDDDKEHEEDVIVKQDLSVGIEVSKGTNITLYIPEKIVEYPDFTDGSWSEDKIKEFADKNGITVEFKYVSRAGAQKGDEPSVH